MALRGKILIIGGLAAIIVALGIYAYRQYELLYAYCYKFVKWEVVQLGLNRVILKPILSIYNISNFGFYITSYKFDIYANNKLISKLYSSKEQYLKPKGASQLNLIIDFVPKTLFKELDAGIIAGLLDTSKLIIKFEGVASARSGGIVVRNIYINMEDSLKNWLASDPNAEYTCPN